MKIYLNSENEEDKLKQYRKLKEADSNLNVLYKEDLMKIFKMGRTKFKQSIDSEQFPF